MKCLLAILLFVSRALVATTFTLEDAVQATLSQYEEKSIEEKQGKSAFNLATSFTVDSGPKDPRIADVFSRKRVERTSVRLEESKQFRAGTRLDFTAEVNRVKDRKMPLATNGGNLNFRITQPLLKGRKRGEHAIAEVAGEHSQRAEAHEALHSITEHVLHTILRYWDAVLANKQETEESEENLSSALFALEAVMGVPVEGMLEDFPDVEQVKAEDLDIHLEHADAHRQDLIAARVRQEELHALLLGAENSKLPKLDAYVDFNRHSAAQNGTCKVGLNFSVPLTRREEMGRLRRVHADFNRQLLETMKLKEAIFQEVEETFLHHLELVEEMDVDNPYHRCRHAQSLARLQFASGAL